MDLMQYLKESRLPQDDEMSKASPGDTRRTRFTFRHLNRLRKQHELKKLEMAAHRKFVKSMYGAKSEEDSGGGF